MRLQYSILTLRVKRDVIPACMQMRSASVFAFGTFSHEEGEWAIRISCSVGGGFMKEWHVTLLYVGWEKESVRNWKEGGRGCEK